MRILTTMAVLVVAAGSALADEVVLRSGHKVVGIQSEDKDRIVVETGYGTVSYPREEVVSVTKGETPLHAWPVRYAEIEKSKNAADFTKLAAWARENNMPKHVGRLMERALELEPDNAEARAALGHVQHQGRWVHRSLVPQDPDKVQDGGRWVSKLEKALEDRKKIDAESRQVDRDTQRRQKDERRRRDREEAQRQAMIRAATEVPPAFDGPSWFHSGGPGWGGYYWGVGELIAVDWLVAFSRGGAFPITGSVPRPMGSTGGVPAPFPGGFPVVP